MMMDSLKPPDAVRLTADICNVGAGDRGYERVLARHDVDRETAKLAAFFRDPR